MPLLQPDLDPEGHTQTFSGRWRPAACTCFPLGFLSAPSVLAVQPPMVSPVHFATSGLGLGSPQDPF